MKYVLGFLCLVLLSVGVGCAALSHYVTPAQIDKEAVEYVVEAEVAEPDEYSGYANMVKAQELVDDVEAAHATIQLDLQQQVEKDNLNYNIVKGASTNNFKIAQQREAALFGEKGLLSLGLTMAGFGGFTGLLGLMRKRPNDWSPEEVNTALSSATGKAEEEVRSKGKAFAEVVKGVEIFKDNYKKTNGDVAILQMLKDAFKVQDSSTQIEVAKVLKG